MKNFVILNAEMGSRTKSYGPKCLLKLADGQSVLDRQINTIKKHYPKAKIYHALGFEANKIIKNKAVEKYFVDDQYLNYNHFFTFAELVKHFNLKDCFLLFGDIVFDDRHFPKKTKLTTVYGRLNNDKVKVGINSNNGIVSHMMWGLDHSWAEMAYLGPDFIEFIRNKQYLDKFRRAYFFEMFNEAIDAGLKIGVEPLGSEVLNVEKISDIDIINSKFSINAQ